MPSSDPNPIPISGRADTAVRTGVYVGVGLSVVLVSWLFAANRIPFLSEFALARNLTAAALLLLIGLLPVVRFLREPLKLWASSLIGWTIFSLTDALLSWAYRGLSGQFTPFQIFVLGAVTYMIVATLAWIGNIVWRAWAAHPGHEHHPVN